MEYHLCENRRGRSFIEEDLRRSTNKKEKAIHAQLKDHIDMFNQARYQEMIDSRTIAELRGVELFEFRLKFVDKRGRIMFVIVDDVAHMLHLFIKKSTRGIKTDPKHIEIALKRLKLINCL